MDAETSTAVVADGDALSSILSDRDLRVSIQVWAQHNLLCNYVHNNLTSSHKNQNNSNFVTARVSDILCISRNMSYLVLLNIYLRPNCCLGLFRFSSTRACRRTLPSTRSWRRCLRVAWYVLEANARECPEDQ